MEKGQIVLKNVRVHNLQGVDLELTPGELIVFTGVSGSGKSSLAFDTIYVEGWRRYVESLSSYARRHLHDLKKPEADFIEGISPTVAIEQKTVGKNPRSTVGTITGLYDFLRVVFARLGTPRCPISLQLVSPQSTKQIIDRIFLDHQGKRLILLSPYVQEKKGELKEEFTDLQRKGFAKVRLNKEIVDLSEELSLDKQASHTVEIVVDRLTVKEDSKGRLIESVETALEQGKGSLLVFDPDRNEEVFFSTQAFSPASGLSYPPLTPQDFSFNHPVGMCPHCQGLGITQEFALDVIIDPNKSIREDFCRIASSFETIRYGNIYTNLAKLCKVSLDTPWEKLPKKAQDIFLYGTKEKWTKMTFIHKEKGSHQEYVEWKGMLYEAKERYLAAKSDAYKKKMEEYFHETTCSYCKGSRIRSYPAATLFHGKTIQEITSLSLSEALCFFSTLSLTPLEKIIGEELIKEITERLCFLKRVGLHYLSLDREASSLSGGEGQRVRLASQIGSGLVGATYILDEPSIGLHPRDNQRLLDTLIQLKDKGNTVLVVEHDEETILSADTVVDVGPLAGKLGGKIIAKGSPKKIIETKDSLTGKYLSGELKIPHSKQRKIDLSHVITLKGASHHNLQKVNLTIPLSVLISVTGVSGSGKSSLIIDTLYPALANTLKQASLKSAPYKSLSGVDKIDKVIAIDQTPIGRTPRSNPATYTKLFDEIRDLFAMLPQAQALGLSPGRFSFNVKEGCCTTCSGMGMLKLDMDFLEDEWILCSACQGKRFDETTLSVHFKGKNIYDVLTMDIDEALLFFDKQPKIQQKLALLANVGLGYLEIGQPSPTLSGGEAQRIKLAKELARPSTGKTIYILDEPTTGLHFHDVKSLLSILQSLVDKGNTVLMIEHNVDCMCASDWIIDIGPEGGRQGGKIIAEAPPKIMAKKNTPTGKALLAALQKKKAPPENPQKNFSPLTHIKVRGASQNNLKDVDAMIPIGGITICTGPSGSGKSSFAFETIYAEGSRRYLDSLSHYARQFIKQMPRPKVDQVEGLLASIAVEQKKHAGNPRSTIGTMTEIYDFLRIVYAHLGTPFCPETGEEITQISPSYIVNYALTLPEKTKLHILAPFAIPRGESFQAVIDKLLRQGFIRIRLNETIYELEDFIPYDPKQKNTLFVVIDRLIINSSQEKRLYESIEKATTFSKGSVVLMTETKDHSFHLDFTVRSTGKSYPPITPHTFSFNTENGMCPDCEGLGYQYGAGESLREELSTLSPSRLFFLLCKEHTPFAVIKIFTQILGRLGIDADSPIKDLSIEKQKLFFFGDQEKHSPLKWRGIIPVLLLYARSGPSSIRQVLSYILVEEQCHTCQGSRLSPLARNVKIEGISIASLCAKPITEIRTFIHHLSSCNKTQTLEEPLKQISLRLQLLEEIGLGYLSLDRSAPTLSGGETQRIRLSRQLGSGMTGCLYVLDEPTIGLHPYENDLLNKALKRLKSLGNTLLLVEHDPMTMEIADYILDFGPAAGLYGGKILAAGTKEEIKQNPLSLTGEYLSGKKKIPYPDKRRESNRYLSFANVSKHNICDLSLSIPIGVLTACTGVSGSGKSTLIMDILRKNGEKAVAKIGRKKATPVDLEVDGLEHFDKLLTLDQNPAGTTSRADIATYTELLTPLRYLFGELPEAKARGLLPKHFSYNHIKGMCLTCFGLGKKSISLQFLPPVQVECESCKGLRLKPQALGVYFKGKNLGQVLSMTVSAALDFFGAFPKIVRILEALIAVGLEYLTLGQDIASLSGGESQRLRLSCELAKRSYGKTLYLFDEPSIGLHSVDIAKLVPIFHALVDKGNTVILIEHHIDLIMQCDHIIEMGPGAGTLGGKCIYNGPLPGLLSCKESKTAPYLPLLSSPFNW